MSKDNSRSINILLCIAGVLCCIGSGFITAPKGLLADDSISIVQTLPLTHMIVFFALPSAFMVLACVLVILSKLDILSICSVMAGGMLFAMMDFQFGVSHRAFSGILINMIGVILVATAVALQVFATETGPVKVSRKAAKSRNPKDFRYERSHRPAYDDIYLDTSDIAHHTAERQDSETSATEEYQALDELKADEEEAAAQKAQEDEIEAMLLALSADTKSYEKPEAEEETAKEVEESLSDLTADYDVESEALIAEIEADAQQAAEELGISMSAVSASSAMTHMAEALETPNKTMTDFYEGIEEIFLDQDDH